MQGRAAGLRSAVRLEPLNFAIRSTEASTSGIVNSPAATAFSSRSSTAGTSSVVIHSATSAPACSARSTASGTP